MKNTFVIAEAGANHNRSFEQAKRLIDIAVEAQADAVKFQTYSSETLYAKNTPDFAGYEDINSLIKNIELPRSWQRDLKLYCDDSGIEFMSTPFDEKAVDELYDLGVKRFKIAAFEATDPRIVRYVAQTGLPVIFSAGISCDIDTVRSVVEWIKMENSDPDITVLHCNSAYPTPIEDICLNQMAKIRNINAGVRIKVGISDHTEGILVPPLAVAMGAEVVEKHYTISRMIPGPDHGFAIEPMELVSMIRNIRETEKALRDKPGLTSSESDFLPATRSLVSSKKIMTGDQITEDNTTTMRPYFPGAIRAMEYYSIIETGAKAIRDIEPGTVIKWFDISKK